MTTALTPSVLAQVVISTVPGRESDLTTLRGELAQCRGEIVGYVRQFAFDRYYNWGIQLADTLPPEANYFLAAYPPARIAEFQQRLTALDVAGLLTFLIDYCQARYSSTPTSLYIYGGYLYGVTEQVADLDLLVVLEGGFVIEKDIDVECDSLSSLVHYERRPEQKIGLAAISRQQIHAAAENNSVLRSAVIAGTTAVRLWGEPFHTSAVPVAILLYNAVELMTWGFKFYFEYDSHAHHRGIWRVVEAAYIVDYIAQVVGVDAEGMPPALSLIKEHLDLLSQSADCNLEHFLSGVEAIRPRIFALKEVIREMALQALSAQG